MLAPDLSVRAAPGLYLAGQLSGVEGYIESAAMGLLAGLNAARLVLGRAPVLPPPDTAHGALLHHLVDSDPDHFQPSNVNFGLFPPLAGRVRRRDRGRLRAELALARLAAWQHELAET